MDGGARPNQHGLFRRRDAATLRRQSVVDGLTLVVSHWGGEKKGDMGWLDAPCEATEIKEWGCTDAYVESPPWPWLCSADDATPPECAASFRLEKLEVTNDGEAAPPPAPPPELQQLAPHVSAGVVLTGVGFVVGLALGLALRIGDRRGGKGAHVVLGALKGEHVALYKEATPARTAVPLEQPIVVNEVAGQTEL